MSVVPPDPHVFVLFGASGDLSQRKLLPALYRLCQHHEVPFKLLGVGRSPWDDAQMQAFAQDALVEFGKVDAEAATRWCADRVAYAQVTNYQHLDAFFDRLREVQQDARLPDNVTFYLALPPQVFPDVIHEIGRHRADRDGWTRLVIEKPFGHDLPSARNLNELVHRHFSEDQLYRIDHYLGKETVQNLLAFRFANALFEPLWNRNHIERIEITVAETVGVEDRAGYYDQSGALRDMVQNHLTQLFTLTAMEAPAALDAAAIRQEKLKVLRSTLPLTLDDALFGQYVGVNGQEGYRANPDVPDDSRTETFVALRLQIQNWRWQGVPFLLRTGKQLPRKLSEIAVFFRCPPVRLFESGGAACDLSPNVLRIRIQPDEGFSLAFEVKTPGPGFQISTQQFQFRYADAFGTDLPEAYETLLLDVAEGDQTLFVHGDEVEAAWQLYSPFLQRATMPLPYDAGTWGPPQANRWFYNGATV